MKKLTLLIFTLCCLTTFAQNSKTPITQFGYFEFGMTMKEVQKAVKKHSIAETSVRKLKTNIEVENIDMDGIMFHNCILSFGNTLNMAIFTKYCNSLNHAEALFNKILTSLESKYGKTSVNNFSTAWYDADNRIIILKITQENDNITLLLSYIASLSK